MKMSARWVWLIAAICGCGHDATPRPAPDDQRVEPAAVAVPLSTAPRGGIARPTVHGTAVQLGDQFHTAAIARRNDDGTITTECFDDPHQAEAFLRTTAPAVLEVK